MTRLAARASARIRSAAVRASSPLLAQAGPKPIANGIRDRRNRRPPAQPDAVLPAHFRPREKQQQHRRAPWWFRPGQRVTRSPLGGAPDRGLGAVPDRVVRGRNESKQPGQRVLLGAGRVRDHRQPRRPLSGGRHQFDRDGLLATLRPTGASPRAPGHRLHLRDQEQRLCRAPSGRSMPAAPTRFGVGGTLVVPGGMKTASYRVDVPLTIQYN